MFKKVPTVARALAGFEKVRAELRAVKEHHDEQAAKHDSYIEQAEAQVKRIIADAEAAAARAVALSTKLKQEAEAEARDAVKALARFEEILGL